MNNFHRKIILAGLIGGIAEIVWISFYSHLSTINVTNIARQISSTILPFTAETYYAPMLGILIHLILSLILAYAFVFIVFRPVITRYGTTGILLSSVLSLLIVWKINFFIILPIINPTFTELLPVLVTLISKLLFGTAMGWALTKDITYNQYR